LKLVLLGDSGVGKSALLDRYVNRKFTSIYKATIGSDFLMKELLTENNKLVALQIWDTAGQERFQSLGKQFYRGADCCMLVYDVGILDSFHDLETWYTEFLIQSAVGVGTNEAECFPFLVVGNKTDRGDRVVSRKMATDWCHTHGQLAYIETSAKDGTNVEEAFAAACESAFAHHEQFSSDGGLGRPGVDLFSSNVVGGRSPISRCPCNF